MHRRTAFLGLCLLAFLNALASAEDGGLTLRFDNPGKAVAVVPVKLKITSPPKGVDDGDLFEVTKIGDEKTPKSRAFVKNDGGLQLDALLRNVTPGPNVYSLRSVTGLELVQGKSKPGPIGIPFTDPSIAITIAGEPFATHRIDAGPKPILWPLLGPGGVRYTRAFPLEEVAGEDKDHPHQRSLWFTYGLVNGIDFWSEAKGHGSIREGTRILRGSSWVGRSLHTSDDWLGPDGKKVLYDNRSLTIWDSLNPRFLDLNVFLIASEGPVEFGDTKEGMFGIRVPSSMDVKAKKGGKIVNAEGLTDGAAWGKRSAWVDYSGPVDGKMVGITILEHPTSYGHPTPWHVRDYGLFAANPFGKHEFGLADKPTPTVLPKGESFSFRYRVILHEGDATAADPAAQYKFFAKPPKMTLTRD